MTGSEVKGRWRRVLRYSFGAALLLLAGINLLVGSSWYLPLGIAVTGGIILVGRRRIFRPGVNRSGDEVVCRYIPWYEGNAYVLNMLVPALGVSSVGAGWAPGNPGWLRYTGIILLILTPVFVFSAVRMWRRCLLAISPSALSVRLAGPKDELTEIRRDCVLGIGPKVVPNGVSGESLQVEIAYRAADLSSKTVLLGLQLSVQPVNLVNALVAWKGGANDEPGELIDRIEGILRGRATAGV